MASAALGEPGELRQAAAALQGLHHIDQDAQEVELSGQPFFLSPGIEAFRMHGIDADLSYPDPGRASFDLGQ
jgi:hypothetical protein